MNSIQDRLICGESYFGSGSYNTPEFNTFFKDFKRWFTTKLKRINATEIEFSKGHFYLSGFFKVNDQHYYFSLSDVRGGFNRAEKLLVRTAKHNKDYTGGRNTYHNIDSSIIKSIAREFRLTVNTPELTTSLKREQWKKEFYEKGFISKKCSAKQASLLAWEIVGELMKKNNDEGLTPGIRVHKFKGGKLNKEIMENNDYINYYYDGFTKRFTIENIQKRFDLDLFIKTLNIPERKSFRINYFTREKCELEPEALALHDFIKTAEKNNHPLFKSALLGFRERYPSEYMVLLD